MNHADHDRPPQAWEAIAAVVVMSAAIGALITMALSWHWR